MRRLRPLTKEQEERLHRHSLQHVRERTAEFRDSSEPGWQGLRKLLEAEEIAPSESAIADYLETDSKVWSGIIVTPTERAFEFSLDYLDHVDGRPVVREVPEIVRFRELDANGRMHQRRNIELGREFLASEKSE